MFCEMTLEEAIEARHSVRAYSYSKVPGTYELGKDEKIACYIAKYHFEIGAGDVNFEWI